MLFRSVSTIEEVLALAFPNDEKRKAMPPIVPKTPPKDTTEVEAIAKAVALAVREALRER